jgi:hypothetical protein
MMAADIDLVEEPARTDRRRWRVKLRDSEGRHLKPVAELTDGELHGVPGGWTPIGREWTEEEIIRGVIYAVEHALVLGPPQRPTKEHFVRVISIDLYRANGGR